MRIRRYCHSQEAGRGGQGKLGLWLLEELMKYMFKGGGTSSQDRDDKGEALFREADVEVLLCYLWSRSPGLRTQEDLSYLTFRIWPLLKVETTLGKRLSITHQRHWQVACRSTYLTYTRFICNCQTFSVLSVLQGNWRVKLSYTRCCLLIISLKQFSRQN